MQLNNRIDLILRLINEIFYNTVRYHDFGLEAESYAWLYIISTLAWDYIYIFVSAGI